MSTNRWAAAAALIACWTAATAAQQGRTLSATDVATVKKEVTEAVDKYYRLFTAQDMKALPEQVYNIPWILTRYKKDGSVMSVGGVAYAFNRTKDGWRIITYTGTAKDLIVACN